MSVYICDMLCVYECVFMCIHASALLMQACVEAGGQH